MESWKEIEEEDLEKESMTNWGEKWPMWKTIYTMTWHDGYHRGQIRLLRAMLKPSDSPPPSMAELTRYHLGESWGW